MNRKQLGLCGATLFGFTFTVALLSQASMAWALDEVSVRLDWIPGSEHAFMYLGKEEGWFAEAGIDLEILAGRGSTVSVKLVGNGDNDFAFSDGATLVAAWEAGVPLVSLAVLYHDTPTVVVSKAQSKITRLRDLCGKKVGVMIKSTTYAQFKGMLKAAHVNCEFEEVPVSPGGRELMAGTVVAQHHYNFLISPLMRLRGIAVNEIPARKFFHLYSQTLITSEEVLRQRPDVVRRFIEVAMRSLRYSLEHPDEALASFLKARPEANAEFERKKLAIVNRFFTMEDPFDSAVKDLGKQSAVGWAETAEVLYDLGVTETAVETTGKFTNEFLQ